jgi:mRNA-degrading endonuclease toxin of MazEF toxin-antitoxin module
VRYNFLWDQEKRAGMALGSKDRPCAIVVYHASTGDTIVVPITHSPPEMGEEEFSIEVPAHLRSQLGLDSDASWIRVSEVNRFRWPGIHLRPLPSDPSRCHYGMVPPELFEEIKARLHEAMKKARVPLAKR